MIRSTMKTSIRTVNIGVSRVLLRLNGAGRTRLMAAAMAGNTALMEDLLEDGADSAACDENGRTALHYAVKCARPEAAACLLAYGANHTMRDNRGRQPLALDYTDRETLHAIRQRYRRFRTRRNRESGTPAGRVREWADALERDGIVRISGLIQPKELAGLRREFTGFVEALDRRMESGEGTYLHYDEKEHWWPKDHAYITNDAFSYSPQLVKLCCKPELLEIARYYVGKPPVIQRGVAMRYLPSDRNDNDQFRWHHDMEEKRIKMMVLLTDVDEDNQCMSYILGSHVIYHPYSMFFDNCCSPEYCRRHTGSAEVYHAAGKAGDIYLFDSNGAHRGNRQPDARTRDAFFVEYTADTSDLWGCGIPGDFFDKFPVAGHNPFTALMAAPLKWEQRFDREHPTWVENLPFVERWL